MFEQQYQKELDSIKASSEFKQRTIKLLLESQTKQTAVCENIVKSSPKKPIIWKRYALTAACIAILLVSGFVLPATYKLNTKQDKRAQPENYSLAAAPTDNPSTLPFTIEDAQPVEFSFSANFQDSVPYQNPDYPRNKNLQPILSYQPPNTDFYNWAIKTNPTQLPYYNLQADLPEKMQKQFTQLAQYCAITTEKPQYVWASDNQNTVITVDAIAPSETAYLKYITANFQNGYIFADNTQGILSLWFNNLPVKLEQVLVDEQLTPAAVAFFTQVACETNTKNNLQIGRQTLQQDSRMIYAFYFYEAFEDYLLTIENKEINSLQVFIILNADNTLSMLLKMPTNRESAAGQLPCLSIGQALWLLYDGQYIAYDSPPIVKSTLVDGVELVYLPIRDTSTGIIQRLPYYKFYVKSPMINQSEPNESLFYTYYVNAKSLNMQ